MSRPGSSRFGWLTLFRIVVVSLAAYLFAGCPAGIAERPTQVPGVPPSAAAPAETRITVEPQSAWAEAIVYFVIVDRFADGDRSNDFEVDRNGKGTFHGGDIPGLRQQLDDLARLGVTTIWITPVVKNIEEFVTGAGFPDWAYHGYWADDFYSIDGRFGTEAELSALVDDCHSRGMRVLLDVVYNHAGYDSHYVTDPVTRSWLRVESRGECGDDDVTSCVAGLPDFRTELPEVADYLMGAHLGLADRVGLDGFRLDTVKHVALDFWKEHRARTRAQLGEEFFLLGEVWGGDPDVLDPWFAVDAMDAGFDFTFQGSALAFVQGRGRSVAFNRYLERRHRTRAGYLLAHFLSSHDVPTALYLLDGDLARFRLAVILQFTTTGIPVIFYGEEVGRLGGDWPDNRSDMPWGSRDILPGRGIERHEDLFEHYRRLAALRRAHPALWRGDHASLAAGDDTLAFARTDPETGRVVLVAVNRSGEPGAIEIEAPGGWNGSARDAWNDRRVGIVEGKMRIEVPALSAAILVEE